MAIPMIETGYRPEFGLGALYQGFNAANADNSAQEELVRQFLANQREQQMQPLDIQAKKLGMAENEYNSALNQAKLASSSYIPNVIAGYEGQMNSQVAAGDTAKAEAPGKIAFFKAQQSAMNPQLSEQDRAAAKQQALDIADLQSRNPTSMAQERLFGAKRQAQQNKPMSYGEAQAAVAFGQKFGLTPEQSIELAQETRNFANGNVAQQSQVQQQPAQTAIPQQGDYTVNTEGKRDGVGGASWQLGQQTPNDIQNRLFILNQELAQYPNDPALKAEIVNLTAQMGKPPTADMQSTKPSQGGMLSQKLEKAPLSISGREARYSDNVAIAANEAVVAIQNITSMPFGVSSGFFGSERYNKGILDAPMNAMKNNLSKESTLSYNAEIDNIGAFYARLINGGLSPAQADIDKFTKQYRIQEGEPALTALTRLAQMRQAFERAAEIKLKSAATPKEQHDMWESAVVDVKKAIPITVSDVNQIRQNKNPKKTVAEALADANQSLRPDTVDVNGKTYTKPRTMSDADWKAYKQEFGAK